MKILRWLAPLLVILGALGYLIFGKLEKNLVYFVTPTELLAKGEQALNQPVRLGGMVKKGTVQWDSTKTSLTFALTDGNHDITVASHETPPQMFQEEMGIVVEGKLATGVVFEADRLMVKHSNEYHPPKEGQKPRLIYKELVK